MFCRIIQELLKRSVLSTRVQIFDPLWTFIAIHNVGKNIRTTFVDLSLEVCLYLQIWEHVCTWFELNFRNTFPRTFHISGLRSVQLNGFSDDPQTELSAVLYIRCQFFGKILSPSKPHKIALPRLELSGSRLLATLINFCLSIIA